jgi:hypothetical protein
MLREYFKFKGILESLEAQLCKRYLLDYVKLGKITPYDAISTWKLYGFNAWDLF